MSDAVLTFLHPIGLDATCAQWVPNAWGFVPDLLGHGRRPWPGAGTSLADMADAVARDGPERMDVVGALMGGSVALHLALRHPDRVSSMVIIGTSTRTDRTALDARADVVAAGNHLVGETLERWFAPEKLAERPQRPQIAYAGVCLRRISTAALAGSWRALAHHDVRADVDRLTMPITFVAGAKDVVHGAAELERIARTVPVGRFVAVDSAHMIPLDNPVDLAAAVDDHLRRLHGRF